MNSVDISGVLCVVLGFLVVILVLYVSPWFLIVSGAVVSAGIVLIIVGGNMCRAKQDRESYERSLYAVAIPKVVTVKSKAGSTMELPLVTVVL